MIARNSHSRATMDIPAMVATNAAFACWDGSVVVNAPQPIHRVLRRGPVLILLMTVCATILAGAAVAQCSRTTLGGHRPRPHR